jgi:hypothetical protein
MVEKIMFRVAQRMDWITTLVGNVGDRRILKCDELCWVIEVGNEWSMLGD